MCHLMPIGSCPFSDWEEPGSLFTTTPTVPSQILVHMDKISSESYLLWFPLSHPSSYYLFLYVRYSSPLNIFVLGSSALDTAPSICSISTEHTGKILHPAFQLCLNRWEALLGAQWRPHQSFELPGGLSNFCLYAALHPVLLSEKKKAHR